jgi:hypothetical protein
MRRGFPECHTVVLLYIKIPLLFSTAGIVQFYVHINTESCLHIAHAQQHYMSARDGVYNIFTYISGGPVELCYRSALERVRCSSCSCALVLLHIPEVGGGRWRERVEDRKRKREGSHENKKGTKNHMMSNELSQLTQILRKKTHYLIL